MVVEGRNGAEGTEAVINRGWEEEQNGCENNAKDGTKNAKGHSELAGISARD